jgi:hypothetical protein
MIILFYYFKKYGVIIFSWIFFFVDNFLDTKVVKIGPGTRPASGPIGAENRFAGNQENRDKTEKNRWPEVWIFLLFFSFRFQYFFKNKNIKKIKIRNKPEKIKKNMILIKILQSYDFFIYHGAIWSIYARCISHIGYAP